MKQICEKYMYTCINQHIQTKSSFTPALALEVSPPDCDTIIS